MGTRSGSIVTYKALLGRPTTMGPEYAALVKDPWCAP
jgi:hypothetical protein